LFIFALNNFNLIFANILFVLNLIVSGFTSPANCGNPNVTGYDLAKPDKTLELPGLLREISGVSDVDQNYVACIQDEKGILFIYDLGKNEIKQMTNFGRDGDYEDLALVGKTVYILRSDGFIIEISDYTSQNLKLKSYATAIPSKNNEGLFYDAANNRLLISTKNKIPKEHELKDMRFIYAFDLKTKKTALEPVYIFDADDIRKFARKDELEILGTKKKKDSNEIKFLPSAIAIHPITKNLYLLSAADHMLFIFEKGSLKHIEKLDHKIFHQPEGISFLKNGDMLISNEGLTAPATILRFNYLN
jgi:hypothetical protein